MDHRRSIAQARLKQVEDIMATDQKAISIPFDPDFKTFPRRKDVPRASYSPPSVETAWVWGEDDSVGLIIASRNAD